ncbi:hypothetical protein CR51_35430 [Caballeronia megalochromosomata]|nr:hypothetical protein CR51_35430 [Caballeronia megalochromosomata]
MPDREIRDPTQTWNRPPFGEASHQQRSHRGGWSDWDDDDEFHDHGFGWSSWHDDDDDSEESMNERMARDKHDFLQMFNVRIDRREAYMSREFTAYVKFIRERLRLSAFDLPVDGAGITRVLKRAVSDGRLIPAINRDWSGHRAVFRHYAPQKWPASGGGLGTGSTGKALTWTEFTALRQAKGELGDSGSVFDVSSRATDLDAAEFASARFGATAGNMRSAGTDWLGVAASVAGAAAGGMLSSGDSDDDNSMFKSLTDGDTPLSGEAFEYEPDSLSDDTFDIAARNVKMTGNEPGGFRLNPNGLDTDYFDGDGNLTAQYHESHGAPHGHNYFNGERDKAHIPMSPIPQR